MTIEFAELDDSLQYFLCQVSSLAEDDALRHIAYLAHRPFQETMLNRQLFKNIFC